MPASLSSAQDVLSTNPAAHPRTLQAPLGGRVIRGALSFGYFSLGKQRKVTRPPAGGRKPAAGEPGRHNTRSSDDHTTRHWIPADAGMTSYRVWPSSCDSRTQSHRMTRFTHCLLKPPEHVPHTAHSPYLHNDDKNPTNSDPTSARPTPHHNQRKPLTPPATTAPHPPQST